MIVHIVHEGELNFTEDIALCIDIDWDNSTLETIILKEGFQQIKFIDKPSKSAKQPRCVVFEIVSIKIIPPKEGVNGGSIDDGKIEYAGRGFGVLPLTHKGDIVHGLNGYFRVPIYSELYLPTLLETLQKVDPWQFIRTMETQQRDSPLLNFSLLTRVCVPQLQVGCTVTAGLVTTTTQCRVDEQHLVAVELSFR